MPRPPEWLKRLVLPTWNEGHRLGRRARVFLEAVVHRRREHCTCCGATAWMLLDRRVIPDRLADLWGLSFRLREALVRKETLQCSRCGAKLRGRRLASVLLDLYPPGDASATAADLATWARSEHARGLRIAELNRIDGVHEALAGLPNFCPTDFREDAPCGVVVNGIRNEDLTCLTFADGSFDLVLTSETLEHVPDLGRALAEIRRVLVPGGIHLFTVPVLPGTETTFARAVLEADGTTRHLATPICHPGGDVGYPVFTEFGRDLHEIVRRAGFEVTTRFGPTTEDDLAQVFIARKPA